MRLEHPTLGLFLRAVTEHFDSDELRCVLLERLGIRYSRVTNDRLRWDTQAADFVEYVNRHFIAEQAVAALRDDRPQIGALAAVADAIGLARVPRSGLEVLVRESATPYRMSRPSAVASPQSRERSARSMWGAAPAPAPWSRATWC